jgi:hypothetical protein
MKPAPFDYVRPTTLAEACRILAQDEDALVLAGGQTLIPLLAMRLARPTMLVDIGRLPELGGMTREGDCIVVGATTRQADAERAALTPKPCPPCQGAAMGFLHPVFDSGDDRVHDYGLANAVGRITDRLIAVSRLIYAGHVARYANAKIVVGIGGAALPYVIGRLRRNYELDKAKLGDPDLALASLHYDTIVQDPRALRYLVDVVGAGLGYAVSHWRSRASQDRRGHGALRRRTCRHPSRHCAATIWIVTTWNVNCSNRVGPTRS